MPYLEMIKKQSSLLACMSDEQKTFDVFCLTAMTCSELLIYFPEALAKAHLRQILNQSPELIPKAYRDIENAIEIQSNRIHLSNMNTTYVTYERLLGFWSTEVFLKQLDPVQVAEYVDSKIRALAYRDLYGEQKSAMHLKPRYLRHLIETDMGL